MTSQSFFIPSAPVPAAQYAPAARRGPFVAVSGQVPFLPGRTSDPIPGFHEQTRTVFGLVTELLAQAGARLEDVLTIRIYLTRQEDFAAMNEIFDEVFGSVRPARTTIWVDLPGGLLIEADALAVVNP